MKKREIFIEYANEIKALGYTVYIGAYDEWNYGYIINDKDEIGYFQLGDYGMGVRFSTMHKPEREICSGFSLDDPLEYQTVITKEVIDRCFVFAPAWVTGHDRAKVRKWSAKEFISKKQDIMML